VAKLRAIVLAAGRGVRMGGAAPKTLLPLADKEPMLHYILSGLKAAGIEDLLVVTGFKAADVQAFVDERWDADNVSYVFNARYASWGNFHSVRMGLDQSPGMTCLVVNSDVIVPPDVYRRTVDTLGDLVLAVQRRPQHQLDAEDMRVELDGNHVRGIGKDLKLARSRGEYSGVSLIRPTASDLYLQAATDVEWSGDSHIYYEDVYAQILDKVDAHAAFVESDEYAEVDTPEDVPGAIDVIERHASAWGSGEPAVAAASAG
jgi:choline kinase